MDSKTVERMVELGRALKRGETVFVSREAEGDRPLRLYLVHKADQREARLVAESRQQLFYERR